MAFNDVFLLAVYHGCFCRLESCDVGIEAELTVDSAIVSAEFNTDLQLVSYNGSWGVHGICSVTAL